jgi:hypothetical protein
VLAPLFRLLGERDVVVRIPGTSYVALTALAAFGVARARFGAGAAFAARLFLPIGVAAGAYALRNLAAHGADALARVARHYGAAWVYLGPVWGREAAVARAHRLVRTSPDLGARAVLPGPRCAVYRLGGPVSKPRPGAG